MSQKNRDEHNRWRSVTIAFRVSPEENVQINRMVRMSGLTKQEYLTRNMLKQTITVQGNSRVFKGLRNEMKAIAEELIRISDASEVNDELMEVIKTAVTIYKEMKEE